LYQIPVQRKDCFHEFPSFFYLGNPLSIQRQKKHFESILYHEYFWQGMSASIK
jgi:hypothetical protein